MHREVMLQVATLTGVPLTPTVQDREIQNQILRACQSDKDWFLDIVDATLKAAGGDIRWLRDTLAAGASIWTVADDGRSLQQRVDR